MNKKELAKQVAIALPCDKKDALMAIDAVFAQIIKALKKGDLVEVRGVGRFYVAKRAARSGRNPRTGGSIVIPAKNAIRFDVGNSWDSSIN